MKLRFIKPTELDRDLKATINKTGNLEFTVEAGEKLGLAIDKGLHIAVNAENTGDTNLYVIVSNTHREGQTYRISKADGYFFVTTKDLFDNLGYDYSNPDNAIIYDIKETTVEGTSMYAFKQRT